MSCTGPCPASSPAGSVVDCSRCGAHTGTNEDPFLGVPRPRANRRPAPRANRRPGQCATAAVTIASKVKPTMTFKMRVVIIGSSSIPFACPRSCLFRERLPGGQRLSPHSEQRHSGGGTVSAWSLCPGLTSLVYARVMPWNMCAFHGGITFAREGMSTLCSHRGRSLQTWPCTWHSALWQGRGVERPSTMGYDVGR